MTIAFDVGNVLVDVDFEKFFSAFKSLGMREDPMTFLCDIQARQDIGIKTLRVSLKARFGLSDNQTQRLAAAWNESIKPNEEMLDFLDDLKGQGEEVAILSNMGHEHATHIRENYPRIFDGCHLHLSCEVGARKPTKLYYQSFMMQYPHFAGAPFFDDRPENVVAAKEFGLDGRHFELGEFTQNSKKDRKEILSSMARLNRPKIGRVPFMA